MGQKGHTSYVQKDTIDLRELFAVLKKRKKLIWLTTGIITLLAVTYIFIAKPVYEVKTMIEVGQIDAKPIDNINDIKQKLSYEYQVNVKGKKIPLPRVKAISVPKGSKTILSLTIHSNTNEEGIAYIQQVIKKIEKQYKEKTNAYINSQKDLINLTQEDIKDNIEDLKKMRKELEDYSKRIVSLKREDAALAGIYALQIGQKQTQLQDLKKYISTLKAKEQELKLSITSLMMKPTHVIGEVETLEHPVKPKKKLIVIIAFITGLMLSVFLAFFLEFLQGMKKEETV